MNSNILVLRIGILGRDIVGIVEPLFEAFLDFEHILIHVDDDFIDPLILIEFIDFLSYLVTFIIFLLCLSLSLHTG
jgi:hypothetical protein